MEFKQSEIDNVVLIEISGELMGGKEAEDFKSVLFELINNEKLNIVVDLQRATWMNSSGLGMLVAGLTSMRSSGGDLRLANLSERIRQPFEITRLDTIFKTFDSLDDAVKSFQ